MRIAFATRRGPLMGYNNIIMTKFCQVHKFSKLCGHIGRLRNKWRQCHVVCRRFEWSEMTDHKQKTCLIFCSASNIVTSSYKMLCCLFGSCSARLVLLVSRSLAFLRPVAIAYVVYDSKYLVKSIEIQWNAVIHYARACVITICSSLLSVYTVLRLPKTLSYF